MKVKFLKDHLDHKKGDSIDVDEARANYWQNVGVAEPVKAKKQETKDDLQETVEILEEVSNVDVDGDGVIGSPEKVKIDPVREKVSNAGPRSKRKKK